MRDKGIDMNTNDTVTESPTHDLNHDRQSDALAGPGTAASTVDDSGTLRALLCPLLGILALATIAVVTVSGQFPWFLLALGPIAFFASCLPWKRFP